MRLKSTLVTAVSAVLIVGVALVSSASAASPSDPSAPNGPPAGSVSALAVTTAEVGAIFQPIQPCRIVDTRSSVAGNLGNGSAQSFTVRGTTGFVPQGGNSGGCGIPTSATAVSASVTTTQSAGNGYLTGWPFGQPQPNANFATYNTGLGMTVGADFTLRAPGAEPSLVIANYGGPTHLIIDVTGYYAPQLAGFVEQDGTLTYSSGRITAVSHPSTGNYDIIFDRNVSQCSFQVTPYGYNWVTAVGPVGPNQAHVYIHDQVSPFAQHDTSFHILAIC